MHRLAFVCVLLAACSSSSPNPNNFSTFQACWDEHTTKESFDVKCAIEICCIDHGIGSAMPNTVCGTTEASCQSYVTSNLSDPSDTTFAADLMTACTNYLVDGMHGGTGTGGMCGS